MKSLKEWGADPEEAISRIMNNKLMFLRLLGKFADGNEKDKLLSAIAEKRYDDAFRAAHEIKGVTSTLSLTPLVRTISEVVEDLRCSSPPPQLTDHTEQFLREAAVFDDMIQKYKGGTVT